MSRCNTCPNREGNKCVVFDAPVCDKTLITCLEYDLYNWDEALTKYKRALDIFKRLLDDDFTYGGFDDGRLLIDGAIDITDDEEKLLEELMKGETSI